MAQPAWDRRDVLGGAALFALVVGVPSVVVGISEPFKSASTEPTPRQREVLRETAQLVIPRTRTPGAGDVGVHDFVMLGLAHGLDGTRAPAASGAILDSMRRHYRSDGTLDHLDWLELQLDRRSSGDFIRARPEVRQSALVTLDAEAFAKGAAPSPWKTLKGLILTGYYTSEAGGSSELGYELVPGRFDPDIPYVRGTRAWSSDWTAVEFS